MTVNTITREEAEERLVFLITWNIYKNIEATRQTPHLKENTQSAISDVREMCEGLGVEWARVVAEMHLMLVCRDWPELAWLEEDPNA